MVFGNLNNEFFEQQKKTLPAPIRAALTYLQNNDMTAHETGRFELELEGVPCILQVMDMQTSLRENLRPEIHRKYIDVQLLASGGPELAEYDNDDKSYTVDEDLLATDRDILFYKQKDKNHGGTILLTPGTYVIYYPWDIHVPATALDNQPAAIRKIVIKVPLDACVKGV